MLYATTDIATSGKGNTNNQIAHQKARAIGPALAVANITRTDTSLETEPKLYLTSDPLYHPYDIYISFHPNYPYHHLHKYNIITIANATKPLPSTQNLAISEDCITTLSANADIFLQDLERKKLNRSNNTRADPPVVGEAVIGDLLRSKRLLIPIAIDARRTWTTWTNVPIYLIQSHPVNNLRSTDQTPRQCTNEQFLSENSVEYVLFKQRARILFSTFSYPVIR